MYSTFVINLDKDTERMQYMREQLSRLNMDYRREAAVLGKEYKPTKEEYDPNLALQKGGRELLSGEVGCALSHSKVIKKIVDEQIPFALILEDDVKLPSDFKHIVEKEIKKNKDGKTWEYLLFDYVAVGLPYVMQWLKGVRINLRMTVQKSYMKAVLSALYFFIKGMYIIPLSFFEGVRNFHKKNSPGPVIFLRPVYFAGAYLVSYNGALKLKSLIEPVVYTADQLPNRARLLKKLRFRVYAPLVVQQQKSVFGSSILDIEVI